MSSTRSTPNPYAVIIVSYRAVDPLRACLDSVRLFATDAAAVLVWDNHSDNSGEIEALAEEFPEVRWTFSKTNVGFAAAVNALAAQRPLHDILLLNPDAALRDSLQPLRDQVAKNGTAAAGPAFPPVPGGRPWDNARPLANPVNAAIERHGLGRFVALPGLRSRYRRPQQTVGYLSGACLLISRDAWSLVGPFDERYWLYSEEMDWARRARSAGYRLVQVPHQLVDHTSGGTVAGDVGLSAESRRRLDSSIELYLRIHFGRAGLAVFGALCAMLRMAVTLRHRLRATR